MKISSVKGALEKSRLEGRAEGREEGRSMGIIETAHRMAKMELDHSVISHATGLSLDEITKILKKDPSL